MPAGAGSARHRAGLQGVPRRALISSRVRVGAAQPRTSVAGRPLDKSVIETETEWTFEDREGAVPSPSAETDEVAAKARSAAADS